MIELARRSLVTNRWFQIEHQPDIPETGLCPIVSLLLEASDSLVSRLGEIRGVRVILKIETA